MRKGCRWRSACYKGRRINFTSGLIKKAAKHVENLQRQLFKAISQGKLRTPIRFGMLLKNSYFNKILSLWKVAHVNKGRKTAGVDKMKIKLTDPWQVSKVMDSLARMMKSGIRSPSGEYLFPNPTGHRDRLGYPLNMTEWCSAS